MKAYGLPRLSTLSGPDLADCRCFALPTAYNDGEHTANRGSKKQNAARRRIKKAARREAKKITKEWLDG